MSDTALLGGRRLRALLERHGVHPRKSLGQNFVVDPNTIRKVVDVARVGPGDDVLEIGAGAGSLTLGLAARARRVVAVEKDERLAPVLAETVGDLPNVEVVTADAERIRWEDTATNRVVANLPYNIAATIVLRILEESPSIAMLTVMTQREVGERLAAQPGSKSYGRSTVRAAFFARTRVETAISRQAFWPVPNVDSVLISVERRSDALGTDRDAFYAVTAAAFGQRRKSLRNSLSRLLPAQHAEQALREAGLDPAVRPERVSVDAFVRLAEEIPWPPA